jgi:ABC-2 type transport system permease protein
MFIYNWSRLPEAIMKKIKTIIRKEWAEVFRNRMVIFTVAFLPLLMTAIPLGIIYSTRGMASTTGNAINNQIPSGLSQSMCPKGLSGSDCFQVFMVSEFMMLFMLVPVAIPVTIAAYSIVGEKTTRSLEPLLATPITTMELLVGKCLAAVIPAVLATYAAFGLFAFGTWVLVANKMLLSALLDVRWLIAIFLVGPLLAVLAVVFSLMISSRVNDPRVAEQISMVMILPVLAGFFGQVAGLFILNRQIISLVAVIMLLLDGLMVYLAMRVFQREQILTRWK